MTSEINLTSTKITKQQSTISHNLGTWPREKLGTVRSSEHKRMHGTGGMPSVLEYRALHWHYRKLSAIVERSIVVLPSLMADVTQEHGVEGSVDTHVPVRCLKDSVDNHCNHGQHTAKQAAGRGDDTLRQGAPPQAQQYRDGSRRIQQVAQQEEADHIVVLQTADESILISEIALDKLVLMDLL